MSAPSFAGDGFSSQAASGILRFLKDQTFCDFVLVCQGKRMHVHKVVVCSQSPVFKIAMAGTFQEATSSTYEIFDSDIETVERMIQYLYTGKYTYALGTSACLHNSGFPSLKDSLGTCPDDAKGKTERYEAALSAHIKLLALADKYLIAQLAHKVAMEFRQILSEYKTQYFLRYLDMVPHVYALPGASAYLLRNACVAVTKECFGPALLVGAKDRRRLDEALAATPEFSKELLGQFISIEKAPDGMKPPSKTPKSVVSKRKAVDGM